MDQSHQYLTESYGESASDHTMSNNTSHESSALTVDTATANANCRSVKSIVAWIEASSSNSRFSFASNQRRQRFSESVSSIRQAESQQTLTSNAEDESLNFIAYQHYFTDKPLARCLDAMSDVPAGIIEMFADEGGLEYLVQLLESAQKMAAKLSIQGSISSCTADRSINKTEKTQEKPEDKVRSATDVSAF